LTSSSAGEVANGAVEPSGELRFLALLGLPAFGLALSSTVVSTYLPVIIERLSGPALTGLLIGGEGLVGLFLPSLVGAWSDRTDTRLGPRMPFILGAAALAVASLVVLPLLGSLLGIAIALLVFWVAYFTYYTPYWALYPDLVSVEVRGRAVGLQGTWRSVGMMGAMVGGGVLLGVWQPLPFVVAAGGLAAMTAVVFVTLPRHADGGGPRSGHGVARASDGWRLLRERGDIRRFLVANTLWEFTVAALKTFVVLFFTVGLGRSLGFTTVVLATGCRRGAAGDEQEDPDQKQVGTEPNEERLPQRPAGVDGPSVHLLDQEVQQLVVGEGRPDSAKRRDGLPRPVRRELHRASKLTLDLVRLRGHLLHVSGARLLAEERVGHLGALDRRRKDR